MLSDTLYCILSQRVLGSTVVQHNPFFTRPVAVISASLQHQQFSANFRTFRPCVLITRLDEFPQFFCYTPHLTTSVRCFVICRKGKRKKTTRCSSPLFFNTLLLIFSLNLLGNMFLKEL